MFPLWLRLEIVSNETPSSRRASPLVSHCQDAEIECRCFSIILPFPEEGKRQSCETGDHFVTGRE